MQIQATLIKFNRFRFKKKLESRRGNVLERGGFQRELGEVREENGGEYNERMLYTHCQRISNNCQTSKQTKALWFLQTLDHTSYYHLSLLL